MSNPNPMMENEKIPLQSSASPTSEVAVKFNESIFEVCDCSSSSVIHEFGETYLILQEHDHRPRTVLDQLYNYKGGIVPDTTEAEKSTTNRQVRASFSIREEIN